MASPRRGSRRHWYVGRVRGCESRKWVWYVHQPRQQRRIESKTSARMNHGDEVKEPSRADNKSLLIGAGELDAAKSKPALAQKSDTTRLTDYTQVQVRIGGDHVPVPGEACLRAIGSGFWFFEIYTSSVSVVEGPLKITGSSCTDPGHKHWEFFVTVPSPMLLGTGRHAQTQQVPFVFLFPSPRSIERPRVVYLLLCYSSWFWFHSYRAPAGRRLPQFRVRSEVAQRLSQTHTNVIGDGYRSYRPLRLNARFGLAGLHPAAMVSRAMQRMPSFLLSIPAL
ncbi:hypothetical protein DFH08DRAFT_817251 [Mycena albidolilacea]|uniref:Uncharacterized protein n=1 Tax=Mycena albidolilacea TaxID=1033008 RepID=A0AAD7EIX4_9AGAR|nr:hypothetical protein DFH08DRAFT_817251 [Mycena albidolilacea]